jgi:hypothetical protein
VFILKVNEEYSRIRIQNPDPDPLVRDMDPRIRIRIRIQPMSWIRNTALQKQYFDKLDVGLRLIRMPSKEEQITDINFWLT